MNIIKKNLKKGTTRPIDLQHTHINTLKLPTHNTKQKKNPSAHKMWRVHLSSVKCCACQTKRIYMHARKFTGGKWNGTLDIYKNEEQICKVNTQAHQLCRRARTPQTQLVCLNMCQTKLHPKFEHAGN